MGIFSSIMDKLRSNARQRSQGQDQMTAGPTGTAGSQQQAWQSPMGQQGAGEPMAVGGAAQNVQNIDVESVLNQLVAKKGGGGNWKTSIVDLLKLLDLDSSLNARKELATELDVRAGKHGSAEQNIALHKAVMRKLAENGGKVPDSLRH